MDKDKSGKPTHTPFAIAEIKKMVQLLEESSLNDLRVCRGEHKLVLSKGGDKETPAALPVIQHAMPVAAVNKGESQLDTTTDAHEGSAITSPMVGTFYRASSPSSDNFIELGSTVKEGQVLCIVEAMKMMNQIKSHCAGKVTRIAVESGQAVEFGQVLIVIS